MFDYAKARATAEKIINNFGDEVTFTFVENEGGTDKWGDPIPPVTLEYTGLCTPALPMSGMMKSLKPDTQNQVLEGDAYIYFDSDDPIKIGAKGTVSGKLWTVKSIIEELSSVVGTNVFRAYHLTK